MKLLVLVRMVKMIRMMIEKCEQWLSSTETVVDETLDVGGEVVTLVEALRLVRWTIEGEESMIRDALRSMRDGGELLDIEEMRVQLYQLRKTEEWLHRHGTGGRLVADFSKEDVRLR